ncbi:MAG: TIGR03032 family protein [Pirellulaceae bacterium]
MSDSASQSLDPRAQAAGVTPVRFEYSPGFPGILKHLNSSLAITTYQAGKLAVVGSQNGELKFSFHDLQQAMGIAVGPGAIALGSKREIHLLKPAHEVAPGIAPAGTFDSAWLTRHSFRTGNIHGHELGWGKDGLWVVNTRFSTLCTLDQEYSFVPRWRPAFITSLEATDRCHLNGLAMHEGRPAYVTCHGESNLPGGWREKKATGGVVIDVASHEVIARGFAMPHSPRIAHGKLWVLNSGAGQLGTVDPGTGQFTVVETFPGYARGLSFHGQFAFVGLSKIRETSVFGGMPLEERRSELRCGVAVVDLVTGKTAATLQFHSESMRSLPSASCLTACDRASPARMTTMSELTSGSCLSWLPRPGQSTALPKLDAKQDETPAAKVDRLIRLAEELQAKGKLIEARET